MRLVCPNCESTYEVDGSLFPPEGREVQCSSCEHRWVQFPVEDLPPMVLDPLTAVAAKPPKPSERLPEAEREALRRQAQQEVSFHEDTGQSYGPSDFDVEFEISEEDIRSALRKQVKEEGGNFEKDFKSEDAKSQKRNLQKAAESAGVEVDKEVTRDRWKALREASEGKGKAATSGVQGRTNRLTEALKNYEETTQRASGGKRGRKLGFLTGLAACAAGLGVYMTQEQIVEAYPPAAPYLAQYDTMVNQGRDMAEDLYAEYSVVVMAKLDEFTAGDETGQN